jgi:YHS domain-containing protein
MDDEHPTEGFDVRDHVEADAADECAYCGTAFEEHEVTIERVIYGRKWRFCSDACYHAFRDASDFKDQDLDEDKSGIVEHKLDDEDDDEEPR